MFFKYRLEPDAQTLTILDLRQNEIGDQETQHLAEALRNNTVNKIFILFFHYYL